MCEGLGEAFDLACELSLFDNQLLHAASDGAEREQRATQLWITSTFRSGSRETREQPRPGERPQLGPQRLGRRDEQITELAEPRSLRVRCSLTGGHQRPQSLTFTTAARRRGPLLGKHSAGGPNSVERVGLATRPLPAKAPDLEHLLAAAGQEPGQASAAGAGALDRERTPPRRVLLRHAKRGSVAITVSRHRRLEHDHTAANIDDTDRVLVAMRVDTNHVVQLICNHPH